MRICLATPLYPPEAGGPATYAKFLVDTLPGRGTNVTVVRFSEVRHLPPIIRHVAYALNLARASRYTDLIFAQDTFSVALPAAIVARMQQKPLIIRVPGDFAWEQSRQRFGVDEGIDAFQKKRYGLRVEFLRSMQKRIVRSADTVIVPSQYFKEIVEGWGVQPNRLVHIPNPVAVPTDNNAPTSERVQRTIVSIGRFTPWKGFGVLISLLPALPSWRLVIVGDGPLRSELEACASSNGVADRVLFTGALPRNEALAWCKQADVFVLNTSFESFSFQIVEAMLLEVPIIATNIGSIPELITNGEEGVLVTPDDRDALTAAILSIETDAPAWERRVAAARKRAAVFAPENVLSSVEMELRKLV